MKSPNLAILLSGPPRNIEAMLRRLDMEAAHVPYQFSVYIHVWSEDGGKKTRGQRAAIDLAALQSFDFIRAVVCETPFDDHDYRGHFKLENFADDNSNPAALMGMFQGVAKLIALIRLSPIKFSHVLRLRTDMILLDPMFYTRLECLLDRSIYVSRNYFIPYKWTSDHIMLAPLQKFTKLWPVSLNESFKRDFKKAGYNPERYLGLQKKKGAFNTIDQWVRYKDYQILYKPARSTDPQWVKRLQDEDIVDAFLTPEHKITDTDVAEIECLIRDQKKNQDLYARPFWKKVLTKLWQH